jgi:hypothetical protein
VRPHHEYSQATQVRGKKNLVLEKSLAGPLGIIVKASTLRDYGVDNFFFLENNNADTSQRNVVFIARGECGRHARAIAGEEAPRPSCAWNRDRTGPRVSCDALTWSSMA